jgi:signal transduction histidine kinase
MFGATRPRIVDPRAGPGLIPRAEAPRATLGYRRLVPMSFPGLLGIRDVQIAVVLALAALVQVLFVLPIAHPAVGAVVALGSTLPVAWRRSHPVAAALAGSAIWLIPTDGFVLVGYVAAFFLFYAVTAYTADLYVAAATVIVGGAVGVVSTAIQHLGIGEYAGAVLAVVAPAGVGLLVRRERAHRHRLEELNLLLERERDERARAAISEERADIARELHDIVSHALSIVVLQADAAEAAVETRPRLARAPLAAIRTSAQEALTEMRRLLGVLRTSPDDAGREPLPGMAQLPQLLERATAAGITVELSVDGEPAPLPQSVDLAAYRIVQEALTNAAKHAAGSTVSVTVRWASDRLELRVCDDGPGTAGEPAPDAHGLVGMRERVRIHRGDFTAGAGPDGGFLVHATLPIERS